MEENKNQDLEEIKKAINKQSNTNIVVMTLLIILVLALTGIIINDKFLSGDNKEEAAPAPIAVPSGTPAPTSTPTTTGKVELTANDPTVNKLIKIYDIPMGENIPIGEEWKSTLLNDSNSYRLTIAYKNLALSSIKKTTCANYVLEYNKAECSASILDSSYNDYTEEQKKNVTTSVISEADIQAKYKELFGTNYTYKIEDFGTSTCLLFFYHYNESTKEYVMYNYGSGCEAYEGTNKFDSSYKENDKLYIITKYNSDVDKKESTLTYEFRLENGNYTFVKVTEE